MSTVLVAGVPRSGKSTIARAIAHELAMSYFPLDALVPSLGKRHPELGITHLTATPAEISRVLSPRRTSQRDCRHFRGCRHASITRRRNCITLRDLRRGTYTPDQQTKVVQVRRYSSPADWTEELDEMVLKAFVERYIAESKSIAQQCEALTWEFVDTPTVIIPTL